ncbi:MAG: bifunctional DNA-formamidopyrimidine glycosylase/DNA-(apurinic or apyrimidinic site) lyase [Actinomycetota bacterium]|nr:bifunctional DNA-formamidopyrimidine glycosylase/DNA-(apurinic or apyrimidinic site) lyase [Euzebyaceae bacterium]MDQ3452911.1 bifunctional DNA-formamidopyrimidine glycosylase/DNA-(apurinic or apyrimidinic site) lyase [Actinomycetota bacterium]
MPELPEVESVRRQLAPRLQGRRILSVSAQPQARFHAVEKAAGRRVLDLRRRGKYLLAPIDGGLELIVHLGMTGSFRFRGGADGWQPDPYVRATFTLSQPADPGSDADPDLHNSELDFRDVRRFGTLAVVATGDYSALATLAALGPEPLSDDFDPLRFHTALAASRMAVKPYLLTQRPVAGVGNIYADEALWRARINPHARRVGRERSATLWTAIREVLAEAIEREGTTFRDYRMVNGESGRNADFLVAYGQAGRACPRCGTALRKVVLGGRGTTYCPWCQRR